MNIDYIETHSIQEILNQTTNLQISELSVYFIIAFLIGYLTHYIFSHRRDYFRTPKKNPAFYYKKSLKSVYYTNSEPIVLPEKIVNIEPTKDIKQIKKEEIDTPYNKSTRTRSSRDDLKIIEGIGPKIETILNKAKISTWYRLSKTNIEKLRSILESAGSQYHMHDPSTWPEQAHLAETRQWEQLKRLQNNLNGGKHI